MLPKDFEFRIIRTENVAQQIRKQWGARQTIYCTKFDLRSTCLAVIWPALQCIRPIHSGPFCARFDCNVPRALFTVSPSVEMAHHAMLSPLQNRQNIHGACDFLKWNYGNVLNYIFVSYRLYIKTFTDSFIHLCKVQSTAGTCLSSIWFLKSLAIDRG